GRAGGGVAARGAQAAGEEEAAAPRGRPRQREEGVGLRGAAEPLVPAQHGGAVAGGLGGGGVAPHVGAALLLGHGHAEKHARLGGGVAQLGIVGGGQQRGLPLGGQVGTEPQ